MTNKLKTFIRADIIGFAFCVGLFLAWPQLDILVSAHFFNAEHFYLNSHPLIQTVYHVFAKIHLLYILAFIAIIFYCKKHNKTRLKKQSIYLLCCLLLGPGILVNIILKDNSLGRPRPVHIEHFGGTHEFTKTFYYSGECTKNCSFVSGHASIGFYFMALAWIYRCRQWLYFGIFCGLAIGFARIVQGGHFLSDVIFAGWAIYACNLLLSKYLLPEPLPQTETVNNASYRGEVQLD